MLTPTRPRQFPYAGGARCGRGETAMRDPDDAPIGVCESCGDRCLAVWHDEGIGPYEFWGQRCVHRDWRWVSPCCGATVVEAPCKEKDECSE